MSEELFNEAINSGLPEWVVNAISSIAYEQGHSGGLSEVDNIASSMIHTFNEYYQNQDNPRYRR